MGWFDEMLMKTVDDLRDRVWKRENLEPSRGSVIYTEIAFGVAEHSGIYMGSGNVIHLNGKGRIEKVSLERFSGIGSTLSKHIYVPSDPFSDTTIGYYLAADRAESMVGATRDYNVLLDNCHQFCAGCLTGDFENENNFLWMLKDTYKKVVGHSVVWEKWNWKEEYF